MRIDQPGMGGISAERTEKASGAKGEGRQAGRASRGPGQDAVELSGLSERLRTSAAADPERLERLSEAVAAGRYRVDSREVSRRIVAEMLARSGDGKK
jgi:anti-sigma28 factor (negative regulator of flagellin synthesis)